MPRSMLTTTDNPYNPFTHFKEWYVFDEESGYHSTSYLARVARTAGVLSEPDNQLAIDQAIDEIILYNINGMYKKVVESD